jgi:oligoribonuclease NrnB/cAMP/cGMP phosphodiesterase (DHH superfamily)
MTKLYEKRTGVRRATRPIVVLYHGNCVDGFTAAYAAWKKFGASAEYLPVMHQTPPPEGLHGKEIYTVDFTYKADVMNRLMKDNKRVTSIDHHVSAQHVTESTYRPLYALNHSGAVLAWKYFHPTKKIPLLSRYVEDMDLWKFKMPHTREIISYLDIFDFDFKEWDRLARDFENPAKRKKIIRDGGILLRHEERLVGRLAQNNAERVRFEGHTTFAVNTPLFHSDVGAALMKKLPPISITWSRKNGLITVSLRSNGSVDVSKIAQRFGGGGHKSASGFAFPATKKFPWKILK